MSQAAQWASRPANHAQASQLLAQFAKLDKADATASYARTLDPALVQPVLDAGLKYKMLERAASASDLFAPELRKNGLEATAGVEHRDLSFAGFCLATWLCRHYQSIEPHPSSQNDVRHF